ncbi:hypothetical protein [Halovivax gelatinilyticus]|uniref:hypothetical protein n=1 Tax=Halovivax gelatinilyticus TaxID=2961597 RepID=UPI0020CA7B63|nr:hypothetical protein [Halovivax gelatinilyticus]
MTDPGPPDRPTCYRCGDALDLAHWATIAASHSDKTDRYRDVSTRICLDCLAGIGLLELTDDPRERSTRRRRRA